MGNSQSSSQIPRPYTPPYQPAQQPYGGYPGAYGSQPYPSQAQPPQRSDAGSLTQQFARKYQRIPDSFNSVEQVQAALRDAGLESSNLIVGVDFTKSNEWTGKKTFGGKSLHAIGEMPNPYEQAMTIIGKTLETFDDDNLIPCYGFGDVSTHDQYAFCFNPDQKPCQGFSEALTRYREIVPHIRLAGPTSFAPIVETAVRIVEKSGGQYHVLLIIADGQVTRSSDTRDSQLSPQEKATVDAIVAASNYALSIVLVGVGDGPWDTMRNFDDSLPKRNFDNFQFVDFSSIMAKRLPDAHKEAQFALAALMEIPEQYKACTQLGLIGRQAGRIPPRQPRGPPESVLRADSARAAAPPPPAPNPFVPSYGGYPPYGPSGPSAPSAPPAPSAYAAVTDAGVCPICFTNKRDMAFQCGHQTCVDCGTSLQTCPICRAPITTRIKLYG